MDRREALRQVSLNPGDAREYENNLALLKDAHHPECLFNGNTGSLVPKLHFFFDDTGVLHGQFTCGPQQQGYSGMVHGGIIAAVSDASMAQCLMGHGIVAYTADLSVKYRQPVAVNVPLKLRTRIVETKVGILYTVQCEFFQKKQMSVSVEGRFFKTIRHDAANI